MRPFSQMNEDYELDVTRAEACAMMRREFACVRTACCASGPAYLSSDAHSRPSVLTNCVPRRHLSLQQELSH